MKWNASYRCGAVVALQLCIVCQERPLDKPVTKHVAVHMRASDFDVQITWFVKSANLLALGTASLGHETDNRGGVSMPSHDRRPIFNMGISVSWALTPQIRAEA